VCSHDRPLPSHFLSLPLSPLHLPVFLLTHPATTQIYTLSLHDALPIWQLRAASSHRLSPPARGARGATRLGQGRRQLAAADDGRSEEHTSELQSLTNLVCRLLLEKKKHDQPRRHALTH